MSVVICHYGFVFCGTKGSSSSLLKQKSMFKLSNNDLGLPLVLRDVDFIYPSISKGMSSFQAENQIT